MMVNGAHSSMAEQPAHNRSGLGSSPGGPTIVSKRLHGLSRRWAVIEGGGSAVLERLHGLKRGWAVIEGGGSARPVDRSGWGSARPVERYAFLVNCSARHSTENP